MRAHRERRLPNWTIGLAVVLVLGVAAYLAFAKQLPWGDEFEVKAVFASAQNVRPSSPVRIAGVDVGKVTEVEPLTSADSDGTVAASAAATAGGAAAKSAGEQAAVLTMELEQSALPLHSDATFKLRPRLFLEGNYFVDLEPGSPNAARVEDGHTFPVNQTAYSVQLDQVLTTLQSDVRADLQTFLDQFGNALTRYGGGEGFRELYRSSPGAFEYTSLVNQALLGTEPGDLSGTIRGLDRVVAGLDRDERALQGLVTNLRIFAGSIAAQDEALAQAIDVLPSVLAASRPAFANLNASFPALRAFAREALPGVRSTPETLTAATPFVSQIRALVSERELRGLVADLRPTIPKLAGLSEASVDFLDQSRRLASCFNEVVIPWSEDTVEPVDPANQYPHDPVGRVFEETAYGLSGIASESRSGDANGQYIRVEAGGGTNTVTVPNSLPNPSGTGLERAVGLSPLPILGAMPRLEDAAKTPFRPDVRCETQEPPNLQAGVGSPPATSRAPSVSPGEVAAGAKPEEVSESAKRLGLQREQVEALLKQAEEGGK